MISALRALKDKLSTRIRRDGARETLRYYVLVLFRHGIHYCVYDFWYDRREAHRSAGAAPISAGEVIGSTEGLEGRGYQAFPRLLLLWSIKALDIDPARFSFIDYGSGRGRLLLTAARLPFRRVIGVEFSRRLHKQAEENIASYSPRALACQEVTSLNLDAVDYDPPADNLVAFFYNPFNERVLDKVAERLVAAGQREGRPVYVIFANSNRMTLFAGRPEFRPLGLKLTDRLRLSLLGTVPIEMFRLHDQDSETSQGRSHPGANQLIRACFVGAHLLLGLASEGFALAGSATDTSNVLAAADDGNLERGPEVSPYAEGLRLEGLGRLGAAEAAFTREIALHPMNELAYFNRGGLHYDRKEYEQAVADYTKVIELKPELADAWYNRGIVRLRMNKTDEAIVDLDQAVLRNPAFPHSYCHRGLAYARKNLLDRALLDYAVGIRLGTKIDYCYFNRGDLFLQDEKYDLAIADFTKGLTLNPSNALALLKRGQAHELKGNPDLASRDFEAAARLDPRYAALRSDNGAWIGLCRSSRRGAAATLTPSDVKNQWPEGRPRLLGKGGKRVTHAFTDPCGTPEAFQFIAAESLLNNVGRCLNQRQGCSFRR